jgi:hypothetical protein
MLALEFNDSFDLTAIGTLALAVATFVSLYFARHSLVQTQQQIKLGQEQLANVGSGPALNVEASVSGVSIPEDARTEHRTSARLAGLGEGHFRALLIDLPFWKELWSFTLTVEYSDVAGKGWCTTAVFLRDAKRYDIVTIIECERKRPVSEMVKPVPAE